VNRRQRVKGPVELSAGLLRALEVPRPDVRLLALALACERQGQDLFHRPNVKGWDGGKTWLGSAAVLARSNWSNDVLWGNAAVGLPAYNPRAWVQRHGVATDRASPAFLDLLLQSTCDEQARDQILRAGGDGSAEGLRKALQMIVHCPEFQLAGIESRKHESRKTRKRKNSCCGRCGPSRCNSIVSFSLSCFRTFVFS
jgi:hypothetical protein